MSDPRGAQSRPRAPSPQTTRDRILESAYAAFSAGSVQGVGVDQIATEAGVSKMTLYRHFASKEELVLAFLDLRSTRWTYGWLRPETERLAPTPADRGLAVFDVLHAWFQRRDFEGCCFIKTLLEFSDRRDPLHRAAVHHLEDVRLIVRDWAKDAGVADPGESSYQLHGLMMGSVISATRGDRQAARRAAAVAQPLLRAAA